MVGGSQLQ